MADERDWSALLNGFRTAMLVTRGEEGHLHGRPMAMRQQVRGEEIWFATSIRSKKCQDLKREPQCALTFTAADGTTLSISGRGEVFRDRKLAIELWDRSWSRWFPDGPAQKDLALVRVVPEHVESHDGVTGKSEVLYSAGRRRGGASRRGARAATS
jgi:general stress protein 26